MGTNLGMSEKFLVLDFPPDGGPGDIYAEKDMKNCDVL